MTGQASAAASDIDQRMPGSKARLDQKFGLGSADGLIIPAANGECHRLIERPVCREVRHEPAIIPDKMRRLGHGLTLIPIRLLVQRPAFRRWSAKTACVAART